MSDSGAGNIPSAPKPSDIPFRKRDDGQRFEIERLPPDLRESSARQRIEGDVVRVDRESRSIIVETSKGSIELQTRPNDPLPQKGQRVEIVLPRTDQPQQQTIQQQTAILIPQTAQPLATAQAGERPDAVPANATNAASSLPRAPAVRLDTQPAPTPAQAARAYFAGVPQPPAFAAPDETALQFLTRQIETGTPLRFLPVSDRTTILTLPPSALVNAIIAPAIFNALQISNLPPSFIQELGAQPLLTAPLATALSVPVLSTPSEQQPLLQPIQPQSLSQTAAGAPPLFTSVQPFSSNSASIPFNNNLTDISGRADTLTSTSVFTSPLQQKIGFDAPVIAIKPPILQIVPPKILNMDSSVPPVVSDTPRHMPISPSTQGLQALSSLTSVPLTLTGMTPQNAPVFSLIQPNGLSTDFILQAPLDSGLPQGTEIRINAAATTLPLAGMVGMMTNFLLSPSARWDSLQEALQTLTQSSNAITAQSMAAIIPNTGNTARMGPAILFFMAAIRGGDFQQWMGEKTTDILRREGRGNLLQRISGELGALVRVAESGGGDWRPVAIPLIHQQEIHRIVMHSKREDGDKNEDSDSSSRGTRFLLDLDLDRMGKIQLDALHRPKKLDLIIRSEHGFSQVMQMEMRRAYTNALEQTSLSGEVSFQTKKEKWVTIDSKPDGFGAEA